MSTPALLIFAKEPVAGRVKMRLAATVGVDAAARAYRDLLATTLAHAHAAWRSRIVDHLELWCAAEGDAPFLRGIATAFGASRYAQVEGDLGMRMAHAIGDALTRAPTVLLIGSDCPLLEPARLAQASMALRDHDAVVVPAEDGGYVLIGARRQIPLDNVRWSTANALADTLRGLERARITYATLPACWDVDDGEGLARFEALRNAIVPARA
jgi:rSAM/selenodomain-associated transferase 1